jgi:lysophosphatidylcholine acyltransferase/lyso-PAF acetyltransferase
MLEPDHPNPMHNITERMTFYEKSKFIFPGLILIPLRLTLMVTTLTTQYILAKVAIMGLSKKQMSEPITGWRGVLIRLLDPLHRMFLFSLGFHWIHIKGKLPARKDLPRVIVSNHLSPWEGEAITMLTSAAWVTRRENTQVPIIGTIIRACQHIGVDRTPNGIVSNAAEIHAEIKKRVETPGFTPIAIFAEGTCTNFKTLIKFRRGAFVPGVPILPIVVKFPHKYFDPSWVGMELELGEMAIRLMAQWYNSMEIEVLPVYYPNKEESADPFLYAEGVRKVLAAAMEVPMSEHTHEDFFVQRAAKENKIDANRVVLGMGKVRRVAGLTMEEVRVHMKAYASLLPENPKLREVGINYEVYLRAFGLSDDDNTRGVFRTIVGQDRLHMVFRQYIVAAAVHHKKVKLEAIL